MNPRVRLVVCGKRSTGRTRATPAARASLPGGIRAAATSSAAAPPSEIQTSDKDSKVPQEPRLTALAQHLGQCGFAVELADTEVLVTEPETGVRLSIGWPAGRRSQVRLTP